MTQAMLVEEKKIRASWKFPIGWGFGYRRRVEPPDRGMIR
jgi:hypothetical protein